MPSLSKFLFTITPTLVSAGTVHLSWHECDGKSGAITDFHTSPANVILGHGFTASLSLGPLSTDVTQGATIEFEGSVDSPLKEVRNMPFLNQKQTPVEDKGKSFSGTADLCNSKISKNLPLGLGTITTQGFKCPAKKGDSVSITASAEVSDIARYTVPKGGITVRAKDAAGNEFACAVASYTISGWADEDPVQTVDDI